MTSAQELSRLAVLVHEVRSPVAALSAIAESLRDEDDGGPARLELAHLAIAACRGIERVVVDAALASIRLESVDVAALVNEAVATAALVGGRVEGRVSHDLPNVTADPLRLRQALDNLIANALIHAGPDPMVMVCAISGGKRVRISVQDSGDGVPPAQQERIFERGVRLDAARAGSGLGLAIARAITDAHGGELTLQSAPGEGATFTIVLPLS